MTKQDILEWLEGEIENYPERATGNECERYVSNLVGSIAKSDRIELVEGMRQWITDRSKRTLLAVNIAAQYHLCELKPDIEMLLDDVKDGRIFSPYYAEFIIPALKTI